MLARRDADRRLRGAGTAAQRDESGTVTRSGLVSPGDLQVGDCLRSAPKEGVATRGTVVPCDQAHTAQVFHIADLPKQATYPDERTLARQAEDLCHQGQKNLNLGEVPDDGEVMYFYPVESSWPIERSVQCVLTTDAPLTRSLVRAGAAG